MYFFIKYNQNAGQLQVKGAKAFNMPHCTPHTTRDCINDVETVDAVGCKATTKITLRERDNQNNSRHTITTSSINTL